MKPIAYDKSRFPESRDGFKFRDKERTPASTRKDSLWLRVVSAMQQVQCLMFTVDYR